MRAIESVVNQQGVTWELIVVDDGSTDLTGHIVKEYIASRSQNNIHYFFIENSGVSNARNYGIQKAQGELIAFLDSDDEWLEGKLEMQHDYLQKNSHFPLVHSDEIWIRNGVRVNQMKKHKKGGGDIFLNSLKLCLISPSAVMIKKSILNEFDNFDPQMTVCEDYNLWLKITSKYEVGFINMPLIYKYGGHEDQLSRKYVAMDYWRVKSIDQLLRTNMVKDIYRESAIDVILKKCRVLLNGYVKHNNMDNYCEVEEIYNRHSGKKFHP
jgi:glycosyltransferase involved in cell wall biosynthesis